MKRFTLQINGIRYACIEAGEGPLLLLSHGTFGGKELLVPQLQYLSRWFRCVAFDWRGHAQTGVSPGEWTARDLISDMVAILGQLTEGPAFLGGVSQGGAVSMRVALDYPDRIRALINMCAGPGPPPPEVIARLESLAAVLAEQDEVTRRAVAEEFASSAFHAPGFAGREPARFAAEIAVMLSHPRASVRLLPGVPRSYDDISGRLSEIRCPTLVIWGRQDGRPAMGERIAAAIPNAELVMIDGAGHHVNVDAPESTSIAIASFLRRTRTADRLTAAST